MSGQSVRFKLACVPHVNLQNPDSQLKIKTKILIFYISGQVVLPVQPRRARYFPAALAETNAAWVRSQITADLSNTTVSLLLVSYTNSSDCIY